MFGALLPCRAQREALLLCGALLPSGHNLVLFFGGNYSYEGNWDCTVEEAAEQ